MKRLSLSLKRNWPLLAFFAFMFGLPPTLNFIGPGVMFMIHYTRAILWTGGPFSILLLPALLVWPFMIRTIFTWAIGAILWIWVLFLILHGYSSLHPYRYH